MARLSPRTARGLAGARLWPGSGMICGVLSNNPRWRQSARWAAIGRQVTIKGVPPPNQICVLGKRDPGGVLACRRAAPELYRLDKPPDLAREAGIGDQFLGSGNLKSRKLRGVARNGWQRICIAIFALHDEIVPEIQRRGNPAAERLCHIAVKRPEPHHR